MAVYEPREDSYLILKHVKEYAKGLVLDMGCGSGILGLEALKKGCKVLCADVDFGAVSFVKSKGLDAVESDLFSNVKGKFDLVMFNPPYLPYDSNEGYDASLWNSGGLNGCEVLDKFLKDVVKYLNSDGKVLILFSSLSKMELGKHRKFSFKMVDNLKLAFEELFVYVGELN